MTMTGDEYAKIETTFPTTDIATTQAFHHKVRLLIAVS